MLTASKRRDVIALFCCLLQANGLRVVSTEPTGDNTPAGKAGDIYLGDDYFYYWAPTAGEWRKITATAV